jgi:hypothetical protein
MKVRLGLTASVLLGAFLLQACGADDSTFTVKIRNDTSQLVIDRQCNITCDQFLTKIQLKPGQSATDVESPDGVSSPDKLYSSSGVVIGCLPIRFSKTPPRSVTITVSQSVTCGHSSGSESAGGHDWPLREY